MHGSSMGSIVIGHKYASGISRCCSLRIFLRRWTSAWCAVSDVSSVRACAAASSRMSSSTRTFFPGGGPVAAGGALFLLAFRLRRRGRLLGLRLGNRRDGSGLDSVADGSSAAVFARTSASSASMGPPAESWAGIVREKVCGGRLGGCRPFALTEPGQYDKTFTTTAPTIRIPAVIDAVIQSLRKN